MEGVTADLTLMATILQKYRSAAEGFPHICPADRENLDRDRVSCYFHPPAKEVLQLQRGT